MHKHFLKFTNVKLASFEYRYTIQSLPIYPESSLQPKQLLNEFIIKYTNVNVANAHNLQIIYKKA